MERGKMMGETRVYRRKVSWHVEEGAKLKSQVDASNRWHSATSLMEGSHSQIDWLEHDVCKECKCDAS